MEAIRKLYARFRLVEFHPLLFRARSNNAQVSAYNSRAEEINCRKFHDSAINRGDWLAEWKNLWHSSDSWIDVVAFFLAFGEFPGSRV